MVSDKVTQKQQNRNRVQRTKYQDSHPHPLILSQMEIRIIVSNHFFERVKRDVDVQDQKEQSMNELEGDQNEEETVVSGANAVVQPHAVVVKLTRAPVAPPTVLRLRLDVAVAPLAVSLELVVRKILVC